MSNDFISEEEIATESVKEARYLLGVTAGTIEFCLFVCWGGLVAHASSSKLLIGLVTLALFVVPAIGAILWIKVGRKGLERLVIEPYSIPYTTKAASSVLLFLPICGLGITAIFIGEHLQKGYQLTQNLNEDWLILLAGLWLGLGAITAGMASHRIVLLEDRVVLYEVFSKREFPYSQIKHVEVH